MSGNFTKLGDLMYLPPAAFKAVGASQNVADVTWTCQKCGPVPPIRYSNCYIKGKCACQKQEKERQEAEKVKVELREQARERRRLYCARRFNWLPVENLRLLESRTFDTFHPDCFPAAYRELRRFAHADKGKVEWANYILFGSVGTGKTHLMVATLNELSNQLVKCRFLTAQAIFDTIGQCIGERRDYNCFIDEMCNVDVLAIDDIDKVHIPQHMREGEESFQIKTFFKVINQRYLKQRPTLITTNSPDISQYIGGPAFDRLQENGVLVPMDGPSHRKSMLRVVR